MHNRSIQRSFSRSLWCSQMRSPGGTTQKENTRVKFSFQIFHLGNTSPESGDRFELPKAKEIRPDIRVALNASRRKTWNAVKNLVPSLPQSIARNRGSDWVYSCLNLFPMMRNIWQLICDRWAEKQIKWWCEVFSISRMNLSVSTREVNRKGEGG